MFCMWQSGPHKIKLLCILQENYQDWRSGKCFVEMQKFGKVWIVNEDIDSSYRQSLGNMNLVSDYASITEDQEIKEECAKVAYTSYEAMKSDD